MRQARARAGKGNDAMTWTIIGDCKMRQLDDHGGEWIATHRPSGAVKYCPDEATARAWCESKQSPSAWQRIKAAVVQPIPAEMAGCGSCNETSCTSARLATCETRLAAIAGRPVL
jgi:hypothetical protein